MRQRYGLVDAHVVGHVGRFMGQKNHSFLLDTFAALRKRDEKARLVLVGEGELLEGMKRRVETLGIANSVLFTGSVANANEWYQAFDCFVLPSKWEGLPVVGVEAQAADLPCLFSQNVTLEAKATDKVRYIALEDGPEKWADAIQAAFRSGARRDNRQLMAEHHFDIRREAQTLQARYLELAGVKQ